MDSTKICRICSVIKPLADFPPDRNACKACENARKAAWYYRHHEREKAKRNDYNAGRKDRTRAYNAAYYARRREELRIAHAVYRRLNATRIATRQRIKYLARRPAIIAAVAAYTAAHPERARVWRRLINHHRRARRRQAQIAGAPLTRTALLGRYELHGWQCYYCQRPLTAVTVQPDHRIPLSRGGLDCAANIVPACAACNYDKRARTEREYWDVLKHRTIKLDRAGASQGDV